MITTAARSLAQLLIVQLLLGFLLLNLFFFHHALCFNCGFSLWENRPRFYHYKAFLCGR